VVVGDGAARQPAAAASNEHMQPFVPRGQVAAPSAGGLAAPGCAAPSRPVTAAESHEWHEHGVVCLRGVLSQEWVAYVRAALLEIFSRDDVEARGLRTDMTAAAAALDPRTVLRDQGGADDGSDDAEQLGAGRFLTEIDCFWHDALRHFELSGPLPEIVAAVMQSQIVHYYQDHLFLKEAGSALRTGFHQDRPYFCWDGEMVAVCWVPAVEVSAASGAMCYVRGSHRWAEHQPTLLVSNAATHAGAGAAHALHALPAYRETHLPL
jgi:hypothetical protein